CDVASHLFHGLEIHVPHKASVFASVDPHVDHNGTFLHPSSFHQVGDACRGDDDVRQIYLHQRILCVAVAHGDRVVLSKQQVRHGLSNDIGTSYDNGLFSVTVIIDLLEDSHDACGSAGDKNRLAHGKTTEVVGVQAVHVLLGIDGLDH